MTPGNLTPPPRSFWIISSLLLAWNLLGLMAFVMQVSMSEEALAALPEAQRDLYLATPSWVTVAFAVAVVAGTLGCVLLLVRKKLAVPVLILSLLGILAQNFHSFFLSNAVEVYGSAGLVMPLVVIVAAIFLIWYARRAQAQGWIG